MVARIPLYVTPVHVCSYGCYPASQALVFPALQVQPTNNELKKKLKAHKVDLRIKLQTKDITTEEFQNEMKKLSNQGVWSYIGGRVVYICPKGVSTLFVGSGGSTLF